MPVFAPRFRIILPVLVFQAVFHSVLSAADRPNILFLFADDQRNNTLGCAGHPIIKTPNIDRLAAQGVRFENAFVTTSICWVSRSTILTGQWARTHGRPDQIDAVRDESLPTVFPGLLREAGYRTGFFGKWHAKFPKGYDKKKIFDVYEDVGRNPYIKKMPDGTTRHETQIIADKAIEFLRAQPKGKPFCLNLWFNAAHAEDGDKTPGIGHYPWPATVDGMYEGIAIPPPRLSDPAIYESQPDFLKQSINRGRYFWGYDTPEKFTANMRAYFRMISGIDYEVGRIVKVLEEQGLADNTILIYSADNGYYMGDRGFQGKWSHYEESIRVPMIVYDPRLPKNQRGRVVPQFALNVDLPATFLDAAGVAVPRAYQGRSLMPVVQGQAPADWRSDFFGEHLIEMGTQIPKWEGVRGQRYMYARYFEFDHEFLHDLEKDPDELKNLAGDPAYAKVLEEMRARSNALREVYGGEYVPKDRRKN